MRGSLLFYSLPSLGVAFLFTVNAAAVLLTVEIQSLGHMATV